MIKLRPCRTCIACRQKKNKNELFRIVADEKKVAKYDEYQRINSRGIYLCKDKNCLEKCIKLLEKNKLNIKVSVDKESFKSVIKDVENELGE